MNVIKYMLSKEPDLATRKPLPRDMTWMGKWTERDAGDARVNTRYG